MTENYSVNGTKLDDPQAGWRLMAATLPRSAITMKSASILSSGRDGFTSSPSTRGGAVPQFEVLVDQSDWENLLALFSKPTLVITRSDAPGKAIYGSLKSSSSPKDYPREKKISAVFYVDVPDGAWRSDLITTSVFVAAPAGITVSVFPGLSAPVQDALIRLKGPLQNPQVLDSSGAFIALDGSILAGQYLRFDSSTGRAWVTTTDTWSGGDEVSGLVDFGGPRGVFEITPKFTDPEVRAGSITLSQASYNTGAGFQVRGRAAYLI